MTENETQNVILNAAELRFQTYGYGKTTMAEIAADCDMSAANLYRYFENKQAIAAGLAQQCLLEKESLLKEIIDNNSLSAGQKLSQFIQQLLDHTYSHFDSKPKLFELVDAICSQRPDVIEAHRKTKLQLLTILLQQGQQSGGFTFDDIAKTADAINSATSLFYFPAFMVMYSYDELVEKAANVSQLLLDGLKS